MKFRRLHRGNRGRPPVHRARKHRPRKRRPREHPARKHPTRKRHPACVAPHAPRPRTCPLPPVRAREPPGGSHPRVGPRPAAAPLRGAGSPGRAAGGLPASPPGPGRCRRPWLRAPLRSPAARVCCAAWRSAPCAVRAPAAPAYGSARACASSPAAPQPARGAVCCAVSGSAALARAPPPAGARTVDLFARRRPVPPSLARPSALRRRDARNPGLRPRTSRAHRRAAGDRPARIGRRPRLGRPADAPHARPEGPPRTRPIAPGALEGTARAADPTGSEGAPHGAFCRRTGRPERPPNLLEPTRRPSRRRSRGPAGRPPLPSRAPPTPPRRTSAPGTPRQTS